ncbi:MAG: DUF1573 domain-containing protein [Bacteroidota bacterium]
MTFDESFIDFGTIAEGDTRTHTFTFTNTGDADLLIDFASGSCGCTVPEWPEEAIAPGGTGKITIVYDSSGKEGLQEQEVNIIANTEPIVTELKLKVVVE